MGKIHNIATALVLTGAALGINVDAISQTTENSNNKANIEYVKDSTKSQIVNIDSLDHETIINMSINNILEIY
jgi:hypothetical protein